MWDKKNNKHGKYSVLSSNDSVRDRASLKTYNMGQRQDDDDNAYTRGYG